MLLEGKLDLLTRRYEEIASLLVEGCSAQEYAKLSKEYSDLQVVVELYENYKQVVEDIAASNEMLKDPELKELAKEELERLKLSRENLEQDLKLALIPKDMTDEKSAILEIRAGTGGDEASLFVADLFKMYHRYADRNRWKVEVMDSNEIGIGGYKEIIVSIVGHKVFGLLKFESGVHRVQRVPATETNGRIHTSAATVAVLPEVENVDVEINTNDLRIDTYRASGAGGQHINTTDSAVRITHIPTGIVAQCQDGRSQIKNREKAMTMLRSRIYDAQLQKQSAERADSRKSQVGSGDRSERIRTYNYPQGRVTDHRINLTLYNLEMIMNGEIDEIVNSLHTADQLSKLAEFT